MNWSLALVVHYFLLFSGKTWLTPFETTKLHIYEDICGLRSIHMSKMKRVYIYISNPLKFMSGISMVALTLVLFEPKNVDIIANSKT